MENEGVGIPTRNPMEDLLEVTELLENFNSENTPVDGLTTYSAAEKITCYSGDTGNIREEKREA